jgi:hypothetical protein
MGIDALSAEVIEVFGEPEDSKKEPRSLTEKAGAT